MTKEQDIVERLLDPQYNEKPFMSLRQEAAQTIAALRAEQDELQERIVVLEKSRSAYVSCYEAAEAKIKELEAELARRTANPADYRYWEGRWRDTQADLEAAIARVKELEQQIAFDTRPSHLEINALKLSYDTAIRERDELRNALEPFAKEELEHEAIMDDNELIAPRYCDLTYGDFRRARDASSNRWGGE